VLFRSFGTTEKANYEIQKLFDSELAKAIALLEKPMHYYAGQSDEQGAFAEWLADNQWEYCGDSVWWNNLVERNSLILYQAFLNREEK
jgi:hypothetical protein